MVCFSFFCFLFDFSEHTIQANKKSFVKNGYTFQISVEVRLFFAVQSPEWFFFWCVIPDSILAKYIMTIIRVIIGLSDLCDAWYLSRSCVFFFCNSSNRHYQVLYFRHCYLSNETQHLIRPNHIVSGQNFQQFIWL